MPRPNKQTGRLNCPVSFRLTDEDYAKFQELIDQTGLSASELFRQRVVNNQPLTDRNLVPDSRYRETLFMVNLASRRIIELADRATASRQSSVLGHDEYQVILNDLKRILHELVKGCRHAD